MISPVIIVVWRHNFFIFEQVHECRREEGTRCNLGKLRLHNQQPLHLEVQSRRKTQSCELFAVGQEVRCLGFLLDLVQTRQARQRRGCLQVQ